MVNDYLTEFERLTSRVVGLAPSFLLSCFVSGLLPDIKREVLALQLLTFTQAAALAKLQEDKFHDLRKGSQNRSLFLPSLSSTQSPSHDRPLPPLLPTSVKTNYKKLTHEEMLAHREKGLYYYCDEKFHPSHKCKARFFLLVAEVPEDDTATPSESLGDRDPDPLILDTMHNELSSAQISFNALSGLPAPEALRLLGLISKKQVTILVDGGSTHNFIQARVAKFLNLPMQPTPTLKVMVGNGSVIECHQFFPAIPVSIQGHIFAIDLNVLPISRADIVLGIQWLKPLGPIVTDYSKMTMCFIKEGHMVEWKVDAPSGPHDISAHQLKLIFQTNSGAAYFHIQKCEIEKQIDEMLHAGLIQPSHSPFSSPVLLVKKKDGSWRICVDFRALNSISVKDRFPLPTIDELLDELGGAKWFSKLDLRQGFHQICMHEADVHKTAFRTHMVHYECRVMPFGLCNAPSTFQATMNDLLKPFLHKFVIIFFDDILVYSTSLEAHLHHLERTF
ncbi:uncharacterized protein LOC113871373 [Abrus precatorius]|uniref:Uncharacterized protein LOC113871373 n=1 Tax=Abrus precatorius TaxID=3816 RepID=A0A8B8M6W4_ABRPR|nr:uncharacterized protein LOC113871373 [Abrus precatorius]